MPCAPRSLVRNSFLFALALATAFAGPALAATPQPGPPLTIQRRTGDISLDGELGDPGWQDVAPVTQWFETRVGDNVEPPVASRGWLAYDDRYLYAAFEFDDPDPKRIRAPLGDHDALSGSTDYGGIIVDSRNDGRTAILFLANANGLQYDAQTSDVSGEDSAPDFYWDARGKVTAKGWQLELRVPFSSLRYKKDEAPTWGIMLYRNYPRDRHYQMFTARLPRDVNCFICNESKLTGLNDLPHGSHLVVVPYATAQQLSAPEGDLGTPLKHEDVDTETGLDVKWSPHAGIAIDATLNPDFSQVESDAAQIGANERFALFYAEKRSFFLEGVDLLSTPLQAVYTRTITSPEYGLRATGKFGPTAYTAIATHDRGGGVVVLPGPQGSDAAYQDFESDVGIVRLRRDLGPSYVSGLFTGRNVDGGGHNVVFGPDFQWRPRPTDSFTGQALWSDSRTPDRTDLTAEWDGRSLRDRALLLNWSHSDPRLDCFIQGQDIGADFRADDGFIPQVGYREVYFESGFTQRPKDAFLSRVRYFTVNYADLDTDDDVLSQRVSVGAGMDGRWNSFLRVELNEDALRVGDALLRRFRPVLQVQASPTKSVYDVSVTASLGEEIDFANGREGNGTSITSGFTVRPSDHLELRASANGRWLHVDAGGGLEGRLFAATVDRLRATYQFNSRSFLRLIGEYVRTKRDPSLYTFPVAVKDEAVNLSALFAYKLNFQTVLYAGYGGEREFTDVTGRLESSGRQIFTKVSYAWQP